MIYLKAGGQKFLKIVHLICAALWIGSAFSMLIVLFLGTPENGNQLYMRSYALKLIDDLILIPGAIGCLVTGLIYSIFTKWGFFRHKWIIVKWIMTVAQISFGTFALGPWINNNVILAARLGEAALTDPAVLHNLSMSKTWGTIQALLLLIYLVVSVQKPWRSIKAQSQTSNKKGAAI